MNPRNQLRHAPHLLAFAVAATSLLATLARADTNQNVAVQGDKASLTTAGFGTLTGAGINVGIVEADDAFANAFYGAGAANVTAPNSTLVNGNADLPGARINFPQLPANGGNPAGQLARGANAGTFPNANFRIGNHASEVTGVAIGQGVSAPADLGIAPGSNAQFAARDNLGLGGGATPAGQNDTAATIQLIAQQANTPVINMSFGTPVSAGFAANGSTLPTRFVDWAATNYDKLMVVAGNEGGLGIPSDSYNSINVAATGARGFYNNGVFQIAGGGAVLNYGVAAPYNTTNMTTDLSPITGYGRFKTDIVAPGGNPVSAQAVGTFNAPPAFDNGSFSTTAGGQYEFSNTNAGGVPFWNQDSFNGAATTAQYGTAGDNTAPLVAGPPYSNNPGANLGAGDFVQAGSLAGTSFAAPLVSGASALIYQYYVNSPINQGFSADHRVMKAILLNGATHTGPDGNPITHADATTQWARLAGKGVTPSLREPPPLSSADPTPPSSPASTPSSAPVSSTKSAASRTTPPAIRARASSTPSAGTSTPSPRAPPPTPSSPSTPSTSRSPDSSKPPSPGMTPSPSPTLAPAAPGNPPPTSPADNSPTSTSTSSRSSPAAHSARTSTTPPPTSTTSNTSTTPSPPATTRSTSSTPSSPPHNPPLTASPGPSRNPPPSSSSPSPSPHSSAAAALHDPT